MIALHPLVESGALIHLTWPEGVLVFVVSAIVWFFVRKR